MAVSVYTLETFRFNFSDWADCINIKARKVSIKSNTSGVSSAHFGELAKEFMRIAALCIEQGNYSLAHTFLGCAQRTAMNAIIARNVERCREKKGKAKND